MSRTSLTPADFQLLVEHAPVMLWRAGPDARRDFFNASWLSFTGRALAEEQEDGWTEGVHPDDRDRCWKLHRDHFERRVPFVAQYRLRRHDGEHRTVEDRGVPLRVDGAFAGFVGCCVDVEPTVRAARENQHAFAREQQARVAAEALAAEVSTQFRAIEATLRGLRNRT